MSTGSGATSLRSTTRRAAIGIVLAIVIAASAGFWLGHSTGRRVHWTTGTVSGVDGQATIETGEFTYGVAGSVPNWIDENGSTHQLTYPECLTPGEHENVRFAWVSAKDPETVSSRIVVAVDCPR